MYVGGKAHLGQGKLQSSVGLALGVYYSTVETSVTQTGENHTRWGTAGWGLSIPIGGTFTLGETVFINGNYCDIADPVRQIRCYFSILLSAS